MRPSILLVDDEPATRYMFSSYLSNKGYHIIESSSLKEAKEAVSSQPLNAVILDLILPDGNGIDWIQDLKEAYPDVAVIVITGAGDIPIAVEAMRSGADNFLTKPVNMTELDVFLQKSLEMQTLRRRDLTSRLLKKKADPYFSGSTSIKEVKELVSIAATNNLPVLIHGETGTGKSLLARWIHEHSRYSSAPFVEMGCSMLRGELLASELFGHVKGSFTSAVQDRQGLIEVAHGGTLFLDEIGDMDLSIQAQFLKVLEDKQYRRLGEVKVRRSDFRIICATNKNLIEEIKQGKFREDLYFRINSFPIFVPPLRDRLDDLRGLIRHQLGELGSHHPEVSQEVMDLLKRYPWPGNIRELKNMLERAYCLAGGGPLRPEHFHGIEPPVINPYVENTKKRLNRLEEEHIKAVIRGTGGDKKKAALILGISKSALYRKLKKFKEPL